MKQFLKTKATGKLGVIYVANVIFESGSIFREISEDTDVGIDGYIEFVENEVATGILVAVQIKAGSSYLVQYSDAKYFTVMASKRDMIYWNSQPIPIAIIAYDPNSGLSGWIDITGYIRQNPSCLENESTKITIHSTANPFTVNYFKDKFKQLFTSYHREANLLEYANLMVSHDSDKKIVGFLGLMRHPTSRFSKLTCFLLLNHLFNENRIIRLEVTDSLSRYLPHPEAGFNPPDNISEFVLDSLKRYGIVEINQLLETAWFDQENLMQRGSISQSVGVIITNIPNFENYLSKIIINPSYSIGSRLSAMALVTEFFLEKVIIYIATNFYKIDWGDVQEEAEVILEIYEQEISNYEETMFEVSNQNAFDKPELDNIFREASLAFLIRYENLIYQIVDNTTDLCIKFEGQHALHKIMDWKQSQ